MSNGSLNVDKDTYINISAFPHNTNVEKNFAKGTNGNQNRLNRDLRTDQIRFDSGSNMNQKGFDKGPKIDLSIFGSTPHMDQNRFDKGPNMNQNRFDDCPNQDQNRFYMSQNTDKDRFDMNINIDQNRFKGLNMDQNRLNWGSNMDQCRVNNDLSLSQNRFDNNASLSELSKSWKSNDQKFGRNNREREAGFKSNFNVDSQQCWAGPNMDRVQNRQGISSNRCFDQLSSPPEKRTFNEMAAENQWKCNTSLGNFRQETPEGINQEFPNKRPRRDSTSGGYMTNSTNNSCGQNSQLMNSYPFHAPPLHLPPPPLLSSTLPVMKPSITQQNQLIRNHCL